MTRIRILRHLPQFALSILIAGTARGGTLYFTDFDEFSAGNNQWSGTGGWTSTDTTSGAQGIVQDPVGDLPLGKAAYLGYETPAGLFTTVFRTFNHDPIASGLPLITFESLLGVQDSTNGLRDRFHISFYNLAGDFLAAITFDNATGMIRRDDGTTVSDTGLAFLRGDPVLGLAALQTLHVTIDLRNNQWSAEIDGIPIFSQAAFTTTGKTLSLGAVAAEWSVTGGTPADAGNNWLLVADWLVAASPREPFEILSISRPSSGGTILTWPTHTAFDYQVFYSHDLTTWSKDLPNSTFLNAAADGVMTFTDSTAPAPATRFYRVRRSPSRLIN